MTSGIARRNKTHATSIPTATTALTTMKPWRPETAPVVASSRAVTSSGVTGFSLTTAPNVPARGTG